MLPDADDQAKADAAAAALESCTPTTCAASSLCPATGGTARLSPGPPPDPATVAPDGVVHRPAHGAGDRAVTLTATVTVGSATATRAFALTVREKPEAAPYQGYAFSYFTGNSIAGEKIYFAASRGNHALRWDELNGGQPKLESTLGEMGLRDPFLIRSPEGDRFFLIATDLSIGRNGDWDRSQRTGSKSSRCGSPPTWSTGPTQRHVKVSPDTAGNTWAPEAYWDAASASTSCSGPRSSTPRPTRTTPARRTTGCCTPPPATSAPSASRRSGRTAASRHRLDGDQGGAAPTTASPRTRAAAAPAAPTSSRRSRPR